MTQLSFANAWVFHYASLIGSPESITNNETNHKTTQIEID